MREKLAKPPPRPQAIAALLEQIRAAASAELAADYDQAFEFAYVANGWRPESAGRIGRGESDPTGSAVIDAGKERVRAETSEAYRLIGKALDNLGQAADALQRAIPREKKPLEAALYPRTVTRAELADSQAKAEARALDIADPDRWRRT